MLGKYSVAALGGLMHVAPTGAFINDIAGTVDVGGQGYELNLDGTIGGISISEILGVAKEEQTEEQPEEQPQGPSVRGFSLPMPDDDNNPLGALLAGLGQAAGEELPVAEPTTVAAIEEDHPLGALLAGLGQVASEEDPTEAPYQEVEEPEEEPEGFRNLNDDIDIEENSNSPATPVAAWNGHDILGQSAGQKHIVWSNIITQWQLEYNQMEQQQDRNLKQTNMGLMNEYGCWCYFENDFVDGQGPAQDPIDEICKTLNMGYRCIIMDMEDAGTPCVPYEVTYNSAFGSGLAPFGLTMDNLIQECEAQNTPGSCESMTCQVEGWFLLSYFTWSVWGGAIDTSQSAANGFDHDSTCKGIKAASSSPFDPNNGGAISPFNQNAVTPASSGVATTAESPYEACCGSVPLRHPYRHSVTKDCCPEANRTYNPNIQLCCVDAGTVDVAC